MHPKLILMRKGVWEFWNSDNKFTPTITEEQRAENSIETLNSLENENKPIDTVTPCTDRQTESQGSINDTSNSSNPLKRKYTAENESIESNGNPVLETQQGDSKASTSDIAKARVVSKQKSESKKMKISETTLNTKTANNNKSYVEVNDDNGDFANSSASGTPSECDSDSDSQAKIKKMKMTPRKQYTNSNKDTRARPVVPQMKAPDISSSTANKNLPIVLQNDILNKRNDYKKTKKCYSKTEYNFYIKNIQEVMNAMNFGHKEKSDLNGFKKPIEVSKKCGNSPTIKDEEDENSPSDGSSKSDDHNVLITNKYKNIKDTEKTSNERKELKRIKCENINGSQMVALGNGTTLIDKAIYDKINRTSYSKATRGLLKAVFPRSVLATHSLTGKPSPAFKDKQAKMCLDPKKVLDILNEVRDNFLIQENLVRSVITKTCADEGKMLKKKQIKKKENVPPT